MERSEGFAPIARDDAELLILGSLPGQRSIAAAQYYAHPRNAFWQIMRDVFGVRGDYEARCAALIEQRIALWDVLRNSARPGSMDADIPLNDSQANDFEIFFQEHTAIEKVLCNGRKSAELFRRLVLPDLSKPPPCEVMPSTSPAYAAMSYDAKLHEWRRALTTRGDFMKEEST